MVLDGWEGFYIRDYRFSKRVHYIHGCISMRRFRNSKSPRYNDIVMAFLAQHSLSYLSFKADMKSYIRFFLSSLYLKHGID